MAFDWSKSENEHARNFIDYEKFLGVVESLRSLILQAGNERFVEALKEEYIGYGRQMPHDLIMHLWTKISKLSNSLLISNKLRRQRSNQQSGMSPCWMMTLSYMWLVRCVDLTGWRWGRSGKNPTKTLKHGKIARSYSKRHTLPTKDTMMQRDKPRWASTM